MVVSDSNNQSQEHQALPQLLRRFRDLKAPATVFGLWAFVLYFALSHDLFIADPKTSAQYFGADNPLSGWTYQLMLCAFVIHHLRLFFGWQFIDSDASFLNARLSATPKDRGRKDVYEMILRGLLALSILFFFNRLSDGDLTGVAIVFSFQIVLVLAYDILFLRELYRDDREKAANLFILVGDISVFGFVLAIVAIAFFPIPDATSSFWIVVLFGAVSSIFIGEILSQYFSAFVLAHREALYSVKHVYSRFDRISESDVTEGRDHSWREEAFGIRDDALHVGSKTSVGNWEAPIQEKMADLAISSKADPAVLEVGFGLGLATAALHKQPIGSHLIIEGHPGIASDSIKILHENSVRLVFGLWQEVLPYLRSRSFDAVIFDPDGFNDPKFDGGVPAMLRLVGNGLVHSAYLLRQHGSFIFWDASGCLSSNIFFKFLVHTYYGDLREHHVKAYPSRNHPYARGENFVVLELVKRR